MKLLRHCRVGINIFLLDKAIIHDIISMKCITKNTECQGDKDMKKSKQSHTNLEYENKTEKNEQGLYAWTAKVGSKGQIVIPKEARNLFHIESGDTILLLGDQNQGIALISGDKMAEMLQAIKGKIL